MTNFDELSEFKKEFKRLSKKYRSLADDLKTFKKVLLVRPLGAGKHFIVMHASSGTTIVKAHLACRALRNNHLLRVIYAYIEEEEKIEFIELYFKGDKANEDRDRIRAYLNSHAS